MCYSLSLCVVTFFGGKESNQRKPPEKKASFFPVGATMSDSATALPGKLASMDFVVLLFGLMGYQDIH